jgi:hypothetical protein
MVIWCRSKFNSVEIQPNQEISANKKPSQGKLRGLAVVEPGTVYCTRTTLPA